MAYTIPPSGDFFDNTPSQMEGPEGAYFRSLYAFPGYFDLQDGEEVDTLRIDFTRSERIPDDLGILRQLMDEVRRLTLTMEGQEVVAYSLWELPLYEVAVPTEVCLFDFCFEPPFAGTTVFQGYQYRLWVLSHPAPAAMVAPRVRAFAPLLVAAIGLAIVLILTLIMGFILLVTGKITWKDIMALVDKAIHAPGEAIVPAIAATSWPMFALGFTLIAVGLFLPMASAKVGARAPIGPVRLEGEIQTRTRGR